MPRYYFDFTDGARAVTDRTGRDFRSEGAARQEAILTARDAVAGLRLGLRRYAGWTLKVRDEAGREICSVAIPKS